MAFDNDDFAGISGDVGQENQPLGEFLRSLIRFVPAVLAGAGMLASIVYVATAPAPPQPIAESQIGLTGEVVWPFFDVAKQRAVTVAEDPEFQAALQERLGPTVPLEDFSVESDDEQIIVRLTARSNTPQNAATAANAAATLLLEEDVRRVQDEVQVEVDRMTTIIGESVARVEEIDRRLEELAPLEAAAQTTVSENPASTSAREQLIVISAERSGLTQARSEELRQQVRLSIDLDELEGQLDTDGNELELLAPARPPDTTAERSLTPPLAAFVGAIVAGLGVAVMWDRARGLVRSPWYVEQLAGLRSIGQIDAHQWEQTTSVVISNLVSLTARSDQKIIALAGLPKTAGKAWNSILVYYMAEGGFRVIEAVGDATYSAASIDWHELRASHSRRESLHGRNQIVLPPNMTLLDAPHMRPVLNDVADNCDLVLINAGEIGSRQWDRAVALADTVVLLVTRNRNRVDELKSAAVAVMARQSRLLGTILVPKQLPSMQFVEQHSPQLSGYKPSEAAVR